MLFITVVYEIFLGGNIYMSGAEPRSQEEGDISGNTPQPGTADTRRLVLCSAASVPQPVFTITEKAY